MVRHKLQLACNLMQHALELLTLDTEYLREELEEQLARLHVLFAKMDRDGALRQDREALHAGMLENVGGPNANRDGK